MVQVTVITIDGPSGAGKGTLAHMLAAHLGWNLLDSGALYRVVAYACQFEGVSLTQEQDAAAIAENLAVEFISGENAEVLVSYRGIDISASIRNEQMGAGASKVAAMPLVRQALLRRQRAFQVAPGLVADGRDMGTVVFPNAGLKIFLTASAEERAERRYKQLKNKEESVSLATLFRDIQDRDQRDQSRAVSPLVPADDAILIDSTGKPIEQVFEQVLCELKKKDLVKGLAFNFV